MKLKQNKLIKDKFDHDDQLVNELKVKKTQCERQIKLQSHQVTDLNQIKINICEVVSHAQTKIQNQILKAVKKVKLCIMSQEELE